jgi:hypothetical protein
MLVEDVELQEVSGVALRALLHQVGSYNADAMGDACGSSCGSSCGRGASCQTRSKEMEMMLCGAD